MTNPLVVLVTGASSGLGKQIAKTMLKDGMIVYAAARRIHMMDDLKKLGAIPIQMDIAKDEDIQNVVNVITKAHGNVDVLINNAGFGSSGSIEETPLQDARYQFEVNLFGLARLTQLLLPGMRAKGAGKIINISSMHGKIYSPLSAWYVATKHALEGWSDCLRIEVKPFGIDVVIIEPGMANTEFGNKFIENMLRLSGDGPYKAMADKEAKSDKELWKEESSTHPEVIAKLVLKAIKTKHPRTRYVAGKFAKPLMFIRRWLGDKIYDKIITSV